MFGKIIKITNPKASKGSSNGKILQSLTLRPFYQSDIKDLTARMADEMVTRFTNMRRSPTEAQEHEWYKKASESTDAVVWAIVPNNEELPIGVTGIHNIDNINMSATTGIIIYNKEWWGCGVASLAHIVRTYYASQVLNRMTIYSSVREPNSASLNALRRVGYIITGCKYCDFIYHGKAYHTYQLTWLNPAWKEFLLNGREITSDIQAGINNAEATLLSGQSLITM